MRKKTRASGVEGVASRYFDVDFYKKAAMSIEPWAVGSRMTFYCRFRSMSRLRFRRDSASV